MTFFWTGQYCTRAAVLQPSDHTPMPWCFLLSLFGDGIVLSFGIILLWVWVRVRFSGVGLPVWEQKQQVGALGSEGEGLWSLRGAKGTKWEWKCVCVWGGGSLGGLWPDVVSLFCLQIICLLDLRTFSGLFSDFRGFFLQIISDLLS